MDPVYASNNNISTVKFGTSEDNILELNSLDALNTNIQKFLVVLYSVTALLAFVGNVTVIFVLSHGRRCPLSLRKFLINLSLADVSLALFSIPFTYTDFMLGRWIFPDFMCPVAQFVQVLSVFVSVFTLTTIGIERYAKQNITKQKSKQLFSFTQHSIECIVFPNVLGINENILETKTVFSFVFVNFENNRNFLLYND